MNDKEKKWIMGGNTGISSKVIFSVMTGAPVELVLQGWTPDVPHDPSDFGRCYRLLKEFPEWRKRLREVSDKYTPWTAFVMNWGRLSDMYVELFNTIGENTGTEMYDFMQDLESGKWLKDNPDKLREWDKANDNK